MKKNLEGLAFSLVLVGFAIGICLGLYIASRPCADEIHSEDYRKK